MYRFIYPVILVALYVVANRSDVPYYTVAAQQSAPASPPLFDLTNYDSIVATFYRPGITSDEQHAILRSLGVQPNNRAGIRFLIYMLEVDFPDGTEPPLFYVGGLDAIPARNFLAEKALVELGPAAALQLVDEYLAFHGKTRYADWPHHRTSAAVDDKLQPRPEQTAIGRLSQIITTVCKNDHLAAAALADIQSRAEGLHPDHPTRKAADEFLERLRGSYHVADWQRVFPDIPHRP